MTRILACIALLTILTGCETTDTTLFNTNVVGTVYDLGDVDTPPKAINQPRPEYPKQMKASRIAGSVKVTYIINKEGKCISPKISSSTHLEFEEPTLKAISLSTFIPAMKDGKAVTTKISQIITWHPDKNN